MLRPLALALAILALPRAAAAHGVSHETERRGAAYAVRVLYDGRHPMTGATYQVVAPGSPGKIVREGRTDATGWVEFVPDAPGTWRVRIVDAGGHGKVVTVEVAAPASPPAHPAGGR